MPRDSRERILHAAFTALSRNGYEHTSVKDIAEEAGVAPGLLHYYFGSKQRLVQAVLLMCCSQMELPKDAAEKTGALAAFDHFKAALRDRRDNHALYVELIGVGLHDREVGAGVLEFVRSDRGVVEQLVGGVLAQRGEDPRSARPIAAAVWGAALGIIVQNLVDPDFDADAAVDALAAMSLAAVFPTTRGDRTRA